MIQDQLIEKSKEAFIMAIEIYNKPTIKYRLEGFSFFICNAWELMLKAYLIKTQGEQSIYFSDKPDRTISLENCLQKIFTNEKSPLRRNLAKIIELRNTSTHFITEEYEAVYVPLLQACVFNFIEKMNEFHGEDISLLISENFLNLSVRISDLNENTVRAKYSRQVAEKLISTAKDLDSIIENNNSKFAIRLEHLYYSTKKREDATEFYHLEKEATEGIRIVKELKDPNQTHKYNAKSCIKELNKRLHRDNIVLLYHNTPTEINKFHFQNIVSYFGLKENEKMCFIYQVSSQPQYSYSQQAIDFIFDQLCKAPESILEDMKNKKTSTPGA